MMTFEEIAQKIQTLSVDERKSLMKLIEDTLVEESPPKKHSILEFRGAGAHVYDGTDAQEYVNELRTVWDHRP